MAFRSGFVSIVGRPNVGKSTLLNALVGEKVAIVTYKPQTTRNRIQGVVNQATRKGNPGGQIILVDTPGIHQPKDSLSQKMMNEVRQALESRDLILLMVDASRKLEAQDEFVLDLVKKAGGPVFLILNKVDRVAKEKLLPLIEEYSKLHTFQEIIPISASKKEGLDVLTDKVIHALPVGPRYFPKDQLTDQPERFLVSELIREKVLMLTGQEVPHATSIVVESFEERPQLVKITALIYCEREGQKAILIGNKGESLKRIGTAARLEIEKFLSKKVFLELLVKVSAGWRDSRQFVDDLDWRRQLEQLSSPAENKRRRD